MRKPLRARIRSRERRPEFARIPAGVSGPRKPSNGRCLFSAGKPARNQMARLRNRATSRRCDESAVAAGRLTVATARSRSACALLRSRRRMRKPLRALVRSREQRPEFARIPAGVSGQGTQWALCRRGQEAVRHHRVHPQNRATSRRCDESAVAAGRATIATARSRQACGWLCSRHRIRKPLRARIRSRERRPEFAPNSRRGGRSPLPRPCEPWRANAGRHSQARFPLALPQGPQRHLPFELRHKQCLS